jgi:hypothetical protein
LHVYLELNAYIYLNDKEAAYMENKKLSTFSVILTVIIWGGFWGIFESTVGYLLHLLPFRIGWLVWYPVACFFMFNVYRKTEKIGAILSVGIITSGVKLLNLFLPGRIDKVINPAVSIIFEAIAMSAVIFTVKHFFFHNKIHIWGRALAVFCMNTLWRLIYILYLLILVPDWMREISVIASYEKLMEFLVIHNFFTCFILFGASFIFKCILKPINAVESKLSDFLGSLPQQSAVLIKIAFTITLFCISVYLTFAI